jgi:uncharacterized protein YndB with AHSA1/START domain
LQRKTTIRKGERGRTKDLLARAIDEAARQITPQPWFEHPEIDGHARIGRICEMDVRTGGKYLLEFSAGGSDTMAFHGKYLEVVTNERIVWTNDEGDEGAITSVTVGDQGRHTLLTFHERYPSTEALEEALQGSAAALPEQLEQLDAFLSSGGE